jgi:hypothetical protein
MINQLIEPTKEGKHPKYSHLVLAEIDSHYGMALLTIKGQEGSLLISYEDWNIMRDGNNPDYDDFAYISDEYIAQLEDASDEDCSSE